ncbi:MAG: hypothetical protein KBD48_02910 [Candidatus Pacebacteria bacterium]|nr:hypothetical protein [Candidatus Paceibacterota bacterium]
MEKFSSIDRVVGKISEKEKEQILGHSGESFNDQVFNHLKRVERKKTSNELQIIDMVNNLTNEIRQKYGVKNFDVPPDNIHVVSDEKWSDKKGTAYFNSGMQGVVMRENFSNLAFTAKVFHEMLHFKSYSALQVTNKENPELIEYRIGLTVQTRDGEKIYFTNLNEAVTEEMTKRTVLKILDNKLFIDESNQTKEIISKHPQAIIEPGKPLFDEDTFYAEINNDKLWRESVGRLLGKTYGTKINTERFTYKQERKFLHTLVDKIFQKNFDKFQDKEEVFDMFFKGMITGNILPIGRLVDETFGAGTFRKIGELDGDISSQDKLVNML